ncbi:MAG: ROK family protein [Ferruginibacter sp.]
MKDEKYSIGVDLGGTNVDFGIVSKAGKVSSLGKLTTKDYTDHKDLIKAIKENIYPEILKAGLDKCAGIGIGAPNGNFYKGTIEYPPNLPWKGIIPFADDVKSIFGIPAFLTNDANAAAIGEMTFGITKNVKDFIMITLGTGVGSGIVIDGKLVLGSNGMAGELGHTTIIPNGRTHPSTGLKGSLESYCSATGVVLTAKEMLKNYSDKTLLNDFNADDITSKIIYDCAIKGDKLAIEIFNYTGELLGRALANFVMFSAPSVIVLFGGLIKAGDLIIKPVKENMEKNLLKVFKNSCEIKTSSLPEDYAAILGAAALVPLNIN